MNAFAASAVALLSRYSNNLLKEDAEKALSGKIQGDAGETVKIINTTISFIDSFEEHEYQLHGIYRICGCLSTQQNALNIIENAQGSPLKLYFIYELSTEDKANCIKALLRKMPDTLFLQCQRAALIDICEVAKQSDENNNSGRAYKALQILVYFLPDSHKHCLEALLTHLAKVAANAEHNKMDESNLALLFCSYMFPVNKELSDMEAAKDEIERFSLLFPLLLRNVDELFLLPAELIETFDATLLNQAIEGQSNIDLSSSNASRFSNPLLTPVRSKSLDDPEVVMSQSCSKRVHTPTRTTTDMEMAKLAAEIASMQDGPTRKRLLKKFQFDQRRKMGIRSRHKFSRVLRKAFTPMK